MLCPAKINLGLQVHHRRAADGYHYLSSIFIPIDFGDDLHITPAPLAPGDRLETVNELPPEIRADFELVAERTGADALSGNLVWRALAATRELRPEALAVRLVKRVPTGGGLGGGSSDAGTLLAFVQRQYALDAKRIFEIAGSLGADVPFFLRGGAALCHGTGDIMESIELGPGYGVLCFPMIKMDTGSAYSYLKRSLQSAPPPRTLSGLCGDVRAALAASRWDAVGALRNDFEEPAFAQHAILRQVKEAFFECGALFASLSGSGSSLYGMVAGESEQRELQEQMQARFPKFRFQAFRFNATGSGAES